MGRAFENQRQSQLLTFAAEHSCSSCPAATVRGGLRVRTRNREVPASPADQKLPCLLPSSQNRVSGWNTLVSSFSQLHRGPFTHLRPQAQGSGPQSPPSCPLSARVPARPGPPGSQQNNLFTFNLPLHCWNPLILRVLSYAMTKTIT